MSALDQRQVSSREKTLLAALLLSLWAPLATGIAVVLSRSMTQVADFIRRSVELVALLVSWRVFVYLKRKADIDREQHSRLERVAGLSVAAALFCSGAIAVLLAITKLRSFTPGGNVYPGLAIAVMGLATNSWFWLRYTTLTREHYDPIIDAQRHLYRAKALVDLFVIGALSSVAVSPASRFSAYTDGMGSIAVGAYLVWSGLRTARRAQTRVTEPHEE